MVETVSSLVALSDATAQLVERAAGSIVSVNSGSRWHSSGIHWRSGIIVTAEEVLERDENIELTLSDLRSADPDEHLDEFRNPIWKRRGLRPRRRLRAPGRVFPVPGDPINSTPLGIRAPRRPNDFGSRRNATTS
jgi:hypothetical protein